VRIACGSVLQPFALYCPLNSRPFADFLCAEVSMQIESLSIEDLADLRDKVIATLNDRVTARQRELQGEIDRLGGVIGKTLHSAS
jgi:hypothetical protein